MCLMFRNVVDLVQANVHESRVSKTANVLVWYFKAVYDQELTCLATLKTPSRSAIPKQAVLPPPGMDLSLQTIA